MTFTECPTCERIWNDTDDTGVCPQGHETRADDEAEHQEHLRGLTW